MKFNLLRLTLAIAFSLSFGGVLQAQPKLTSNPIKVTFEPPKSGQPINTVGGATRGEQCFQDAELPKPALKSLAPANYQGLTVAARPTLFVHVPQTTAQEAFFSLQDEQGQYYQTILPLPDQSGIMSIQLPEAAPALEVGKSYKWHFVVMCDNSLKPDSPLVEGYIQRINPESALFSQLEELSPLERAAQYGKAGIWHETLTILAQLKKSQPDNSNVAANWEELLTTVGLETIANQPLLD